MPNDTTRTPRKAAARKVPARTATLDTPAPPRRRAIARPAAIEGEVVGKAETETLAASRPAKAEPKVPTITLLGRTIPVRMPAPEQLSVLLRTYEELGNLSRLDGALANDPKAAERAGASASRLMTLLSRAQRGVLTVMVEEGDREWALDECLDGRLTLNELARALPLALAALNVQRPAAPTTGPQPKARRRA